MNRASYATKWQAFSERLDWPAWDQSYRRAAANEVDWLKDPCGATDHMWAGYIDFRVWNLGRTTELAQFCLTTARQRSEEATKQNAFERAELPFGFPRNRLDFLNSKVFIDDFVHRLPLDKANVLQIAEDEADVASSYGPHGWGALQQSMYQQAIDLLLLVDARKEAKAMIDNARSMRGLYVKELFVAAKLILKSKTPVRDNAEAKAEYRRVFDILRDPEYSDRQRAHPGFTTQRLIMACMWQKFFEPGNMAYDYERAVELLWK